MKYEESSHNDSKPPDGTSDRASVERGKEPSPESLVTSTKQPVPQSNAENDLNADNKEKKSQTEKKCCENISVTLVETGELKKAERWAVGLGIAALVVTVLGLVVAGWTLAVFHAQLVEMQEQTKISRGIANQAAQDSISSENRSREQLALDQRAWVGPTGDVTPDIKPWEKPKITITVSNTGKTPALHVHSLIAGERAPKGTTMTFKYPGLAPGQVISDATIQPGTHVTLYTDPENTPIFVPAEIDAIKRGDIFVYIHGKLTYQDVFGKEQHQTTFCYIVNRNLKDVEDCPQYNYAD